MKLRLEDNTLRLRLSEAEVQTFATTGGIGAATHFGSDPSQQLGYALERKAAAPPAGPGLAPPAAEAVELRYAPGQITILVPAALAEEWTRTDRLEFSAEILVFDNSKLRILVEKDLDCKH